ncbi:MAG: 7-cyano-7-deazaguanine synthase QueC [Proteobacteria bacterium]|nr:7-cyano-7-deazaguanine synthase QueC [Pseudomonadota bacterium]
MSKAIVIFSGGQDSTTCLGWARNRFDEVVAVSYLYGQKHRVEIRQAEKIAGILEIPIVVFDISFYAEMVNSALVGGGDLDSRHEDNRNLPASFVPNRNALFVLLAHSYAQKIKAGTLIAGICQTDYSGYPDCSEAFARSMEKSLNLGSEQEIELVTPLMYLTKAETFDLAEKEGVLDLVIEESHTCYQGSAQTNEWGRGCGSCPACRLREKGFWEYKDKYGE